MSRLRAGLVGLALGLTLLAAAGAAASTARPAAARVDPLVVGRIAAKGETTFWVVLRGRADLSQARGIKDWNERGRVVYQRLVHQADVSQAGVRGKLKKLGVDFRAFWIVNAIRVTAGEDVLKTLAADPDVEEIVPERVYHTERPRKGTAEARARAVEWGISNIKAPQVWTTYGDTGQGIVIASIDTGAQFDHPALAQHYRGYLGNGQYDHNYNWYDPSSVCGSPSLVPCDNNGHGTHTMGTMVGDDGAGNQVGVAPGARWITAKGCESGSCTTTALVSSGQWLLAPTNLNGQQPRTDLRPNIISNSWGDGPTDPFYQQVVDSWVAAGVMPVFANGNSGPGCGTAGVPGAYLNTYAVGAYDSSNAIASFSSRGPSSFGSETKPNISAPGVSVRSSYPTNTYSSLSGTSMATPHVAAAIALMWSAAPALVGNIAQTRQILDQTAIDVDDRSCGGTAADNDVWGEGRLDVLAAVTASPRGDTGTLAGTVRASGTNAAIPGARVDVSGNGTTRTVLTDANGQYQLVVTIGSYTLAVSAFGYGNGNASAAVNKDQTTTRDFALVATARHTVSGVVRDGGGNTIAGASVTILNTPLAAATTNGSGAYAIANVPEGDYDLQATAGRCLGQQTRHLTLGSSDGTLDFSLPAKTDGTYTCSQQATAYVPGSTVLPLSGDDLSTAVTLPAPFRFYGQTYTSVNVSTNGLLDFAGPDTTWSNGSIPSSATPNLSIYAYWDDLYVDASASVRTAPLSGNRFVIEWANPRYFEDSTRRVTFEAILYLDTGQILLQYSGLGADTRKQGSSATVGIENGNGSAGIQYSLNEAALSDTQAIMFTPAATPAITTSSLPDGTRGQPYPGATLSATGGTAPYGWSITGGGLPSALSLSGASISGNVTAADGNYPVTFQVTDNTGKTATRALSIDVRGPVAVSTASLPDGAVGAAYSQTLAASGGKTPYTWSLASGSLPAGLTLGANGTISGVPTTAGTATFSVQASDSGNPTRTSPARSLSITISSSISPPGAPTLSGKGVGKAVQLNWTAAAPNGSTIINYKVYRTAPGASEALLATLGNVLGYKDGAVVRGQTYAYRVSAVSSGGGEGPKSNSVSAAPK
jgi:subtilisin family serine protease